MGRVHLHISGRVQGVYYRASSVKRATALGLTGWVRNLADGRVEVVAEGPRAALEDFMSWCHQGPAMARVDRVEARWSEAEEPHAEFRVR